MRWLALALCLAFTTCAGPSLQTISSHIALLQKQNKPEEVVALSNLGLQRARQTGDQKYYWKFTFIKAQAQRSLHRPADALETLRPAVPLSPSFADERANRLLLQARIASEDNLDPTFARTLFRQAEEEARAGGTAASGRLLDIAAYEIYFFADVHDLGAARLTMNRVKSVDNPAHLSYLYSAYGYLLAREGFYEDAARSYEFARPATEAANRPAFTARLYQNLGNAYYHLRDMERALVYLQKAEGLLSQADDKEEERICLNAIGLAYLDRSEYDRAAQYLGKALAVARQLHVPRDEAEVLSNLARLAITRRDWAAADQYNGRALAIKTQLLAGDPDADLYALVNQARIQAGTGNFAAALKTLDAVCRRTTRNVEPRLDAGQEYVSIYRQLHNKPEARRHYLEASATASTAHAGILQEEARLSSLQSQHELDQEWVRLLVEEGKAGESLAAAESARSRLMLERLGSERAESRVSAANYVALSRSRDAAFVTFWLAPEKSYAWVVTPRGVEVRTLAGESAINAAVSAYQAFVQKFHDPLQTDFPAGGSLRQMLLDPIYPLLNGAKEIYLVPDGFLNSLNFEAIPVNGHYWIDDVTLSIAPSLKILALNRPAPTPSRNPGIFILGDPVPTPEFPRLASASAEIDAVAKTFPGRARVLRGANATAAAYLANVPGEDYIHLAAHAAPNRIQPLQSSVVLSGPNLYAQDVLRRPITARLVTLSACQSAGTRSYQGEGLVGLAWVFLQAGAHGVIAGLWDVSDTSTSQLMSHLYANIAEGQPPAHALRNAKLSLRRENPRFRLPYFWAPFQFYRGTP